MGIDQKCLFKICKTLIFSRIDYGLPAYDSTSNTSSTSIQKQHILLNKALKLVKGTLKYTTTLFLHVKCAGFLISFRHKKRLY